MAARADATPGSAATRTARAAAGLPLFGETATAALSGITCFTVEADVADVAFPAGRVFDEAGAAAGRGMVRAGGVRRAGELGAGRARGRAALFGAWSMSSVSLSSGATGSSAAGFGFFRGGADWAETRFMARGCFALRSEAADAAEGGAGFTGATLWDSRDTPGRNGGLPSDAIVLRETRLSKRWCGAGFVGIEGRQSPEEATADAVITRRRRERDPFPPCSSGEPSSEGKREEARIR